jgi:hypothetical protein
MVDQINIYRSYWLVLSVLRCFTGRNSYYNNVYTHSVKNVQLGLRTVPYYGYGRKKYGYFTGILPVNRTVKQKNSSFDGTVRAKKRVYGRFTGDDKLSWCKRASVAQGLTFDMVGLGVVVVVFCCSLLAQTSVIEPFITR